MDASKRRDLPAGLEGVQRRFERWRQTRRGHARIPERLWAAAVKAAGVHSLHRAVRALRLNYYSLKERAERQAGTARDPAARVAAGRRRPSVRRRSGPQRVDTAPSPPTFLELAPSAARDLAQQSKPERAGTFTSGIVATRDGRRIALFFSGHQHAGENRKDVLSRRAADRGAPIQMSDALTRNLPGELKTIVANCLVHARRRFVDVVDRFPEECRHVLESLAVVYKNDASARA